MSAGIRLLQAIDNGHVVLPVAGRILMMRPAAELPDVTERSRVQVVHGFRPIFDQFVARGYDVQTAPEGRFAAAIVFLPRSRAQGRDLIAQAMSVTDPGGPVIIDGAKTDGVETMLKALRAEGLDPGPAMSKAHGKVFVLAARPLAHWRQADTELPGGHVTPSGAFSADGIDPASALLAGSVPALSGRVADLGAGWGYLASRILASPAITECHLIEAEHDALEAARRNVADPRAVFHWADVTRFDALKGLDHVVTNPPFHTSRAGEPSLGQAFIQASARLLGPRGILWLVANRHLPYELALRHSFGDVTELPGDTRFKLYRAARPAPRKGH